jgi:hypothetical protein
LNSWPFASTLPRPLLEQLSRKSSTTSEHEGLESNRHPIYTGFILMAIGGVLLRDTITGLVVLVMLPVVLWIKLSQEKPLLTQHFPGAYPP